MNIEIARSNMIFRQIRPWNVFDDKVLNLLHTIHRENFIAPEYAGQALADVSLPLSSSQQMMTPKEEARVVQALKVQPDDRVLEIGTGNGYVTAMLASLSDNIVVVDANEELLKNTQSRLNQLSLTNVKYTQGDASDGWEHDGKFNVIAITASMPSLNDSFKNCLSVNGRLFCIIGTEPVMTAKLITRLGENEWSEQVLYETVVTPLTNKPQPQQFNF